MSIYHKTKWSCLYILALASLGRQVVGACARYVWFAGGLVNIDLASDFVVVSRRGIAGSSPFEGMARRAALATLRVLP